MLAAISARPVSIRGGGSRPAAPSPGPLCWGCRPPKPVPPVPAAGGYADSIRHPVAAVKHFDDGTWTLPAGSLVIVDDADHLPLELLQSLATHAAVRTNTKLLLITNHDTERPAGRDPATMLQDCLPWARHVGTPPSRSVERENVIDRIGHLDAGSVERLAYSEAVDLVACRDRIVQQYRDEVTARERFHAGMVARSLSREHSLSRDDGVEL